VASTHPPVDRSPPEGLPAHAVEAGFDWYPAATTINVRIRWFGLAAGFVMVNWLPGPGNPSTGNQLVLNVILALGTLYALVDTWWSLASRGLLSSLPLLVSGMESLFVGLLCYFDGGPGSSFRFYYFLSLMMCAVRTTPRITYLTLVFHVSGIAILGIQQSQSGPAPLDSLAVTLVVMVWITWSTTALTELLKRASRRLQSLNTELQENQALLEQRISRRTAELQESQALLVQQEKQAAFGLLAAGIAHEVGNPLAAISSLVQLLKRRDIDDYTRKRLQMVDDQLIRIQRTLRELVNFSRPATSEQTLCHVNAVIEDALNIAKYYKRKKGKRVETHFAPQLPPLRVVRDQMVQVFLNLILNAMEATDEGGLISISTKLEEQVIRVDVSDDGQGIDPENIERIFQPYFTTKQTGTGLGLFVCRNLVEQSDCGQIQLSHSSTSGTTFTVCLNLCPQARWADLVADCPDPASASPIRSRIS